MIKKLFNNIFVFLIIFAIISISAGWFYYNQVIQLESPSKGQISYSDFRVLWYASYNLFHHVLRSWDGSKGEYPTFKPFWFLDSKLRNHAFTIAKPNEYKVYNKDVKFYHYRYSPFIAFLCMPLGKLFHQGHALAIWYVILNIAFLFAILLTVKQLGQDFGFSNRCERYLVLWGTFFGGLRFYLMNISLGQTDILIAFLFALLLMAYIKNREILCGIFLALILQFKLLFLPVLVYFLFIGKRKLIISTVIAFVTFLFIPAYMLGVKKTITLLGDWFGILSISIPSQILNSKNQSIVYAISSLLLKTEVIKKMVAPKYLFYSLSAALTLLAYTAMGWFRKFVKEENGEKYKYLEVSILIITSLLFSPIAWKAHFVTIIVPVSIAISFTMMGHKRGIGYLSLFAFFILSCVAGTDLTKFIPGVNELQLMNIAFGIFFLAFAIIYSYNQNVN